MALENLQAQIVDSISRISEEPTRSRMTAELDMLIGRYNSTTGTEQEQVKARLDEAQDRGVVVEPMIDEVLPRVG